MGEDLAAEGRMAVRTPMQWEPGRTGGFSSATPSRLVQRMVPDGYGPDHVNVRDQKRDQDSLWTFVQTLIRTYRECPELGWGDFSEVRQPHRSVMAHTCTWEGSTVLAVHNLASAPVSLDLPVPLPTDGSWRLEDVFVPGHVELDSAGTASLSLDGYDHRWFRLAAA